MRFSDMRERVVILSPDYYYVNSMGETVPAWVPYRPYGENNSMDIPRLTITEGVPYPTYLGGSTAKDVNKYAVWAKVTPLNGREYEESQKLRAETTYNVKLRYSAAIEPECKVLYRDKLLNVVSVLNIDSRNRELKLVCAEVDSYGEED